MHLRLVSLTKLNSMDYSYSSAPRRQVFYFAVSPVVTVLYEWNVEGQARGLVGMLPMCGRQNGPLGLRHLGFVAHSLEATTLTDSLGCVELRLHSPLPSELPLQSFAIYF